VEADASLAFVWDWQTDVQNWDDPPARFLADGHASDVQAGFGSTLADGMTRIATAIASAEASNEGAG
jgi:hypothetical protein